MSPIFGRKKEPKKVFDENMKKAEDSYAHGKYENALEYVKKAHEIAREDLLNQEDLSNLWELNGRILDKLGKYDEALTCYDKSIALNPSALAPWINKLIPLTNLEKWSEADKTCDKVLELVAKEKSKERSKTKTKGMWQETTLEKMEVIVWNKKGVALSYLDRLEEALNCYNKALELDPQYVLAYVNKAHIYGLEVKFEEMSKSLLEGYNTHNKKFMKPWPPGEDPDLFLKCLMAICEDWNGKEAPIEVFLRQCALCPRTSSLKTHLILKYKRNGKTYMQEFAPPLCRSMANGIPREQIEEKGNP